MNPWDECRKMMRTVTIDFPHGIVFKDRALHRGGSCIPYGLLPLFLHGIGIDKTSVKGIDVSQGGNHATVYLSV